MSEYTPNDCICGQRPTIVGNAARQIKCTYCQRSGPANATEEWAVVHWNQQTAAPDLLKALKAAQQVLHGRIDAGDPACSLIDTAIANAEATA